MDSIKVLLASANYPNNYHLWGPWNKEANVAIASNENILAETIAPLPYSLPFKFFPYNQLTKIPSVENGPEGKIHRPRFLYLIPKKIFYGYEGALYRKSVENYAKKLQKPDLVHCHHVYPDGYAFIDLCKKWDVQMVVDIHRGNLFTEFLENKAISNKILNTLNFASKIICISHEIKDLAIDHGVNEEKIDIIPLGIDTDIFKSRDKDTIKEKLLINEKNVILYVGQLIKRKGLIYLINAVSYLSDDIKKDLKVIIIGEGPEKDRLKNLCKEKGLNSIFKFIGAVKRETIPYYYSVADIFVLPSLSEGRPVVIYEAMASECAIITTDLEGIKEQIEDNVSGVLIKHSSSKLLSSKIKILLENNNLRYELGRNARKSIFENNLTWDDYSKRVVRLYNNILR